MFRDKRGRFVPCVCTKSPKEILVTTKDESCGIAAKADSMVVATGRFCKVQGVKGSVIAAADWYKRTRLELLLAGEPLVYCREDEPKVFGWKFTGVISAKVDGKVIKENTWYIAREGKFLEVEK